MLVRDAAAKQEVYRKFGQRMLVLTVHECKGLEFQVGGSLSAHGQIGTFHKPIQPLDPIQVVLVYNFFSSSKLGHKWRLMYNLMASRSLLPDDPSRFSHPDFDPQIHHLLCSELKQL